MSTASYLQQWRTSWNGWSDRRHRQGTSTTLVQRNIYILPTRAGLLFVLLLFALLIGAINYQLNLGYLLTFMLAGVGVMSMHLTHRNLRGLTLALQPLEPGHAGQVGNLRLVLSVAEAERYAIDLWCDGIARQHATAVDVHPKNVSHINLAMPLQHRGWQRVARIHLETRFPLGLWRAWTHWQPSGEGTQVLVYPKPESPTPPLPYWSEHLQVSEHNITLKQSNTGEYDGVRPYRAGDAKKRVVWKKFAKADELVTRDDVSAGAGKLLLDFNALAGMDVEARLSRLTSWVIACEKQATGFALQLSSDFLPHDEGSTHAHAALKKLALYGHASKRESGS